MQDPWDIIPEKKSIMIHKEEDISDDDINASNESIIENDVFIDPIPEPPPDLFIPTQEEKKIETHFAKKEKPKLNLELDIEKENIHKSPFDRSEIVISSTLIKEMFFKGNEIDHCPRKIYGAHFLGLKPKPTEPMQAGNFFETLLIGGTRDDEQITQLPRKEASQKVKNTAIKKGLPMPEPEMRIDEIRIRQQAETSKILFYNHHIVVYPGINTQVPVYKIWNGIKIQGHLDIFPTPVIWNGKLYVAIIDVKLTGNINSTFGEFCWGEPEKLDTSQPSTYLFILEDIDFNLNPHLIPLLQSVNFKEREQPKDVIFLYYVADYKVAIDKLSTNFIEVAKTPERMQDIKEVIRKTHANMEMYKSQNYPENPMFDLCKNCVQNFKLRGQCQKAMNNTII